MVWWSEMKKIIGMSKYNNMYVVQPWDHGAVAETSFLSWFGSGIRIGSWWGLCFYKQQRGCSSKEAPIFGVLKNDCLESVQQWISIRRDWKVDSVVDRMQSFLNKRRYPFIASTVQLVKVRYPLLASTSACGWLAWFYIYTCRDIIFYMVHLAIVLFGEGEKSLW